MASDEQAVCRATLESLDSIPFVLAYIDPGTGSLIYQTALTLILGLGLVLRRSRDSITRFVKRLGGRDTASEHASTDSH